jgi:SAM-dependent methyltransferase
LNALGRAAALLDEPWRTRATVESGAGYLDLIDGEAPGTTGATQRLMLSRAVPQIYERWWRPALGRLLKGLLGPGMAEEHRIARLLLGLSPGDGVLDVACGPGNFTRGFGRTVGELGLAVGIDASRTMLARAVADTPRSALSVAYVRGDAVALPFRDASFDAVCCFAALHLFADPWKALDHMTRVLTPGGRIALLTSCRTRSTAGRAIDEVVGARAGIRMFERDEIVDALESRGCVDVRRRVSGLAQFVGGRRAR